MAKKRENIQLVETAQKLKKCPYLCNNLCTTEGFTSDGLALP
jgi:hypothetical protein